jgi:predicted enzyme related to lactoylglutathione lyase
MADVPVLRQVNLVVTDLHRTVAFCRLLGWEVEHPGAPHLEVDVGGGISLEFDEAGSVAFWNTGSPGALGGSGVVTLGVGSRDDVDRICRRVVDGGYACRQPAFDAFWGARFAVVADADGNQFGLMSPVDEALRHWPPQPPPPAP